ncbi:MAG TPA: DUF4038 domain-containing protein [Dictyoglomaceae bacterium]|nr:DUF4038 domain-containing protein [Dictyoglomaceae bacterium]HPU43772.1 DUF4038 domain-containing protein [Dictyoglomaceae bacterium]
MSEKVGISESKDFFLRKGKKFFYLADTCWSAFTNIAFEEWEYYLNYRKMQGFNALQIDILPQWDRSESDCYIDPFEVFPNGKWNYSKINKEYFDRAEKMIEKATEKDFIPALVILWCNYVPGNWLSKQDSSRIIPKENLEGYISYVVEKYSKYNPIYVISGDTDFQNQEAIEYYNIAFNIVKKLSPDSLTTMHLCGGFSDVPEVFINSPNYDFYMYQSCHFKDRQNLSYETALKFYNMPVKRPIINGEPCYEGIGSISSSDKYGRFNNYDVRKAVWQSLLSGAKAGVTYGTHGIWPWHRRSKIYKFSEVYGTPYDWRTALKFPGGFDVAFAKWIFERYDLFDIEPANELLINDTSEVRISKGKDKIVIYTPFNWEIKLKLDGASYEWEGIDLETRRIFKPDIEISPDFTEIKMAEFNNDILILGTNIS